MYSLKLIINGITKYKRRIILSDNLNFKNIF